jgi:hypothetical protein
MNTLSFSSFKSKIFLRFLFLLLGAFPAQNLLAADFASYDITAALDPKNHRITASQKVTFTNNSSSPINELYFHIYPHRKYTRKEINFIYRYAGYFKVDLFPEGFQSGDLRVDSIKCVSKPLTYIIEGQDQTILKVNLDVPLAPGQAREIEIDFTLDIPHCWNRLGYHKDIITLTRWYPILSVLDKAGWHNHPFYIYHQPFFSDSARYRLQLTLPVGQKIACGASLKSEVLNPDQTRTVVLENESPMRDLALAISPSFQVYSLPQDKFRINVFYLEGDLRSAQDMASNAAGVMKFYAQRFGEYPYKEFSIAPSYLGFGGDQSSGMVFIDVRMFRLPGFLNRYSDFMVSHETGHQWFYNIVGTDEYKEMFLDEGMNSYWLLRYLEDKYGYNAKVMDLPQSLKWLLPNFSFRDSTASRYIFLAKNGYDRPVIGELSSFKEPSSIFALAYGKGAAVISMLEAQVGSDVFDRAISRYSREFRFKNASLDDFIRVCQEESGAKLEDFFSQWLKSDKSCDFKVDSVRPGQVVLENKGAIQVPISTRVRFKGGEEVLDHWTGQSRFHQINFSPDKQVKEVSVDPDSKIVLDLDRSNNHWPRKLRFKPVPFYFFPWEIPLFQDRDAYNVVAGPSIGGTSLGGALSAQQPYDNILRLSSTYDFNGKAIDSKLGYELNHILARHNSLGFEVFDYESSKANNDVRGGKVYWRRELWPASYGIFDVNDHLTLYLVKDRKLDASINSGGQESITNFKYAKKNEAIVGIAGSLNRCGPSFDPDYGWRVLPVQEVAGHFLGGDQHFWRSSLELENYYLLPSGYQQKLASRLKAGTGGSADKNLFQLGGYEGLRGYSLKTINGSRMAMASLEYRCSLGDDLKFYFLDNVFCLNKIQGVVFFDAGKAWQGDFSASKFKKDAGLGLRLHLAVAGILEKIVLRLDVAQAINEPKEKAHFWFGLNQSF